MAAWSTLCPCWLGWVRPLTFPSRALPWVLVGSHGRLLCPSRAHAAGEVMPVQCGLQTITDCRRVWGSLPSTSTIQHSSAWVSLGFLFVFPHHLSLFQACLLLPADSSQPSANLLIFSLVHLGFLWPSPLHTPLSQFLRVSRWRGARCTLKEGRKHPERPMMSLAHPVPMTAGKSVFCPSFHRETRSTCSVLCCQQSTNHLSEVYNLA